jgi:hypothetical protein
MTAITVQDIVHERRFLIGNETEPERVLSGSQRSNSRHQKA